jgi:hypothetical protein
MCCENEKSILKKDPQSFTLQTTNDSGQPLKVIYNHRYNESQQNKMDTFLYGLDRTADVVFIGGTRHFSHAFFKGFGDSPQVLSYFVMFYVFGWGAKFMYLSQVEGWDYPNIVFSWDLWYPIDSYFILFGIGITFGIMLVISCLKGIIAAALSVFWAVTLAIRRFWRRDADFKEAVNTEIEHQRVKELARKQVANRNEQDAKLYTVLQQLARDEELAKSSERAGHGLAKLEMGVLKKKRTHLEMGVVKKKRTRKAKVSDNEPLVPTEARMSNEPLVLFDDEHPAGDSETESV